MGILSEEKIQDMVELLARDYKSDRVIDRALPFEQPDPAVIKQLVKKLFQLAFLGYYQETPGPYRAVHRSSKIHLLLEDFAYELTGQIELALRFRPDFDTSQQPGLRDQAETLTCRFLEKLPQIREILEMDLQAFYDGDPATGYKQEIILAYPGFYAITVNRFAHELFLMDIPLIPRMMTELAHSKTGIDIHPGATIGKYFFIDHGTGVVIGETTRIGDHVKIYQGVTLGALSTNGGQSLRGSRRHPTIEDHVTIYSGASILGGATTIGRNSVIGSNVFITRSVAPDTRVSIQNQELKFGIRRDASDF